MTTQNFQGEYLQLGTPDECTDLIRSTSGPVQDMCGKEQHTGIYFIRWAGCVYGPSDKLEDICKDGLLAQAKEALADTTAKWTPQFFVHTDEYGYVDIAEEIEEEAHDTEAAH